jgi:hypothetical protein
MKDIIINRSTVDDTVTPPKIEFKGDSYSAVIGNTISLFQSDDNASLVVNNGSIIANLSGTSSNSDKLDNKHLTDLSIIAGNGLIDGGFLNSSGSTTLNLGIPSTLTSTTINESTTDSHTHAITNFSVSGTTNQIIVTGAGKVLGSSITLSLPQNINTSATPQFARLGLGVTADSSFSLALAMSAKIGYFADSAHFGSIEYYNSSNGSMNIQTGFNTGAINIYPGAAGNVKIRQGANTVGYMLLGSDSNGAIFGSNLDLQFLSNSATASTIFKSSTNNVQLKIDSTGKIGIGQNSPTESLQVAGNVKIESSNSLKFGGTLANDHKFEIKYNEITNSLDFNCL